MAGGTNQPKRQPLGSVVLGTSNSFGPLFQRTYYALLSSAVDNETSPLYIISGIRTRFVRALFRLRRRLYSRGSRDLGDLRRQRCLPAPEASQPAL